VIAWLVLGGCIITPPIKFGAGKSAEEAQHETLGKLMPPQLAADKEWSGDVRTLKLRVWADDEYRAQNVQWQRAFQEELDYANTVVEPMLGVRFDAEYKVWQRHAPGATLDEALVALARQDPGDGVFSVVGLTSAMGLTSATFEHIGLASLPGRYMMLRDYADREEAQIFDRAFPKIDADERKVVHEARRRHKTTSLFLHELGHNLGAPHEETETIMNPTYSDKAAGFSERSRDLMRANIDMRLGREPRPIATVATKKHPTLILGMTRDGQATLGGQQLDTETVDELFRRSLADDRETEVIVNVVVGTPNDAMVRLIDRAKAAGFRRVSIGAAASP
jgi:hypothetical protein